jgi:glycosyltransferase involved in cell wall biosynthesis
VAILSVVIPTRDRQDVLAKCLQRLSNQDLDPTDYEVIVVDDGSRVAVPAEPIFRSNVRYLSQSPAGPATARNRGIRAASGEVVVFLGDDILAPPDFLRRHQQWHNEHPSRLEGMLGLVEWPAEFLSDGYMKWLSASGLQFGYQGLKAGQPLPYYNLYTSNLSAKRSILIEHPFDEDFRDATHEDTDLGLRLERAGFKLFFDSGCRAEHHHFYTLETSCSHRRRVGRAGFLFQQKQRSAANFRWIRRLPWPLRVVAGSRLYRTVAEFADRLGDADLISPYYYLRNSEAFWEGFRAAQAEYREGDGRSGLIERAGSMPLAGEGPSEMPEDREHLEEMPNVSVVILTYNGGPVLRQSLDVIFRQMIDAVLEVVIVDSGSTDGTENLDQTYDVRMVRIPQEQFKYGYARNLGFRTARGEYIATVSQDFVPRDETWLSNLVEPLKRGADIVQGHGLPRREGRPFYWETRRFWFTRESRDFKRRHNGFCLSCVNMATRRDVWQAAGFGDETPMSEDIYFQKRAFEKGFNRTIQAPGATGYHGHWYSVRSLFRRCADEGVGWRWIGETYGFGDMLLDLVEPRSYVKLALGLMTGQVTTAAEILFIWVRPLAVYKGNHFPRGWKPA